MELHLLHGHEFIYKIHTMAKDSRSYYTYFEIRTKSEVAKYYIRQSLHNREQLFLLCVGLGIPIKTFNQISAIRTFYNLDEIESDMVEITEN